MKWEYLRSPFDSAHDCEEETMELLVELGDQGWELCGIVPEFHYNADTGGTDACLGTVIGFFKRPIAEPTEPEGEA